MATKRTTEDLDMEPNQEEAKKQKLVESEVVEVINKRAAEEEPAGADAEMNGDDEAGAVDPDDEADVEDADNKENGCAEAADGPSTPAPASGNKSMPPDDLPVTLAYKTFDSGADCRKYYHRLLTNLTKEQNLNKYEHDMVEALLTKGHPDPARKIGPGIQAIQVREVEFGNHKSLCFFIRRKDGTEDDFSTKKCIHKLFPTYAAMEEAASPKGGRGAGRGGGRGGARGRRGRFGARGGHARGGSGRGGGRARGGFAGRGNAGPAQALNGGRRGVGGGPARGRSPGRSQGYGGRQGSGGGMGYGGNMGYGGRQGYGGRAPTYGGSFQGFPMVGLGGYGFPGMMGRGFRGRSASFYAVP